MTFRLGLLASTIGLGMALPMAAEAATRALVVGVSGYPNLAESLRLRGPKNDSREFANTILRLGIPAADITVLADGVTGLNGGLGSKSDPTKQAILDELDRLADTSAPGDLVVFYFSGHGSQTTDVDGDEEGGNDEIFLPYDVGKDDKGVVRNALVDDELNARIKAILDKGVDFFGIIDACHSATGFRALDDDQSRIRQVDPEVLGVPALAAGESRSVKGFSLEGKTPGAGRAAFFYAAQEIEVAREQKPKNAETDEFYGVFTYNLLKRLNQTPGLTYRTLHQAVIDDIKRGNLMSSQTPELEGELLDEPFLRLSGATARRQWPVAAGKIQAGELSGLSVGTILALYDDPAAPDDKPVAYGMVEQAGATKSFVMPVVYPCTERDGEGDCAIEPDRSLFKKGRFARILEPGVDLTLALSEPVRIDPDDGHDYSAALTALKDAVGSKELSKRISLRNDGYDVAVGLIDGKLAFAPSAGLIDANGPGSSPRLTLPDNADNAQATVASALSRMAKAMALQRLSLGAESAQAVGLVPDIRISRSKTGPSRDFTCSDEPEDYEEAVPVSDPPRFAPCDILAVAMNNRGKKPIDVTVLLVGYDFSITPVWPVDGEANRIHIGESKVAAILRMDPLTAFTTEERLVFVTVPGVSKSHTAFTNLEQAGLRDAVPGETPEIAAMRALFDTSLNDMTRSSATAPARIEEEMSINVVPFFVGTGESQ